MDNDDVQVGRLLSRREVLGLMGAAGMALLVGCSGDDDPAVATATRGSSTTPAGTTTAATEAATAASSSTATGTLPSCVVRPELTEGPYFVDEMLERSDIRSDPDSGAVSEGTELTLTFLVSRVGTSCESLEGATVDVWHCDAAGVYSDVSDPGFDTAGQKFLRGYQVTDASGKAEFVTIYPGWYQGRAVHIHFKIRTNEGGSEYEFTSQFFFDESVTDQVHALEPYAARGTRTLLNKGDGIFQQSEGLLTLTPAQRGSGYAATFDIGLQV